MDLQHCGLGAGSGRLTARTARRWRREDQPREVVKKNDKVKKAMIVLLKRLKCLTKFIKESKILFYQRVRF